ncbi:Lipase-3 domain-containing protein [Mycena venus]|uniref:Lipase-3 domain-containing protein n=1 Tax=Mycena venus TaxID=2733690 RepID=A0A8H6Y8E4_9AGAR|nr:Lipase-3 domain-containing protein [Mycena venus]
MQALSLACLSLVLFLSTSVASPSLPSFSITPSLYDALVLYTKYSSAAYQSSCPHPLGHMLVKRIAEGDTHGFIARDDEHKEIVVSFRGTFSPGELCADAQVRLVPFVSPNISESCRVHQGSLKAYNDVAMDILATVRAQLQIFQRYRIVVTGHSLGGAIASLAAPSLKTAHPDVDIRLFTFGQPRTGDKEYAAYMESLIGVDNIFRAVHTIDGVPTGVPRELGYEHFATEYWQFQDPLPSEAPKDTVKKCIGGEDPTCSDSIPSTTANPAHTIYFGQLMTTNPLLCQR